MIIVLSGLPGAGKSTYAKKWVRDHPEFVRINYDDLRYAAFGPNWIFNFEEEKLVKATGMEQARLALEAKKSLIIDNTNLSPAKVEVWRQLSLEFNVSFDVVRIQAPIHVCVDQDRLRNGHERVGRAVIEGMALRYGMIDWADTTLYEPDIPFMIVDVDGTVADLTHRRHLLDVQCDHGCGNRESFTKKGACIKCGGKRTKKEWEKFFQEALYDSPIQNVINLIQSVEEFYQILIVSGRPEDRCGLITEQWLDSHGIHYDHLFMRKGGDRREDILVKEEILSHLPKDRIELVLDDRTSVVNMWRKNGLTCLQCAPGDF